MGSATEATSSVRNHRDHHSRDPDWGFWHASKRYDFARTKPPVGSHVVDPPMAAGDQDLDGRREIFGMKELRWCLAISVPQRGGISEV